MLTTGAQAGRLALSIGLTVRATGLANGGDSRGLIHLTQPPSEDAGPTCASRQGRRRQPQPPMPPRAQLPARVCERQHGDQGASANLPDSA